MTRSSILLTLWFLALQPAMAFAEGGGHEAEAGVPWSFVGFHAMNLGILVFILYFVARRPISDALRNRSAVIRKSIDDARLAQQQATAKLQEVETRLQNFEEQIEKMRQQARAEAERERETIIAQAEREAVVIRSSAESTIRDETARARRALTEDAVNLAIRLAREILLDRVGDADQQRLATELLQRLRDEPPAARRKHDGA